MTENKPSTEQINMASQVAAQLRMSSFVQRCETYRAHKAVNPAPQRPSRPAME